MAFHPPITIAAAIQKIEYQQLLLPAIQREFVWSPEDIELLFDSLMRDYPIGSLLLWKVGGTNKTDHRYYEILKKYREKYLTHCEEINTTNLPDFEAILDGQQRLTALYLGLKGSYAYKLPRVMWKDNEYALPTRKLYVKLTGLAPQNDTEGEVLDDGRLYDFRFLAKDDFEELSQDEWFEIGQILELNGTFKLNKFIKENQWEDQEFINETLSKLHDVIHVSQIIHYYLESGQDYNKALNIFIRVNSGGEKLDYSDLIMSTTIAGWRERDAREEINNLIDEVWDSYGFEISKDLVLRSYLMLYSDDIKFRVSNFSVRNAQEFETNWDEIRNVIITTFQLIYDFGYAERSMTSKNAALPIIYYLYKSKRTVDFTKKVGDENDRNTIRKWLHAVLLHRIFGGQAEGVLKTIRDVIEDEVRNNTSEFPAKAIAKKLSKTRKSITVDKEFIENLLFTRYEDRYAFPILALLYPHLDYRNGDFHRDHVHPISGFSKRNLTKAGITIEDINDSYFTDKDMYNGIVNLQMLDGNQNKAKRDKTLKQWVDASSIDLKKQLIPNVLELQDFDRFVDERWKILYNKLTEEMTF